MVLVEIDFFCAIINKEKFIYVTGGHLRDREFNNPKGLSLRAEPA